ncbi:MAG: hypothetical protein QOK36_560 [Gaiellales bacterium]|nr:hypothetical protein [Gaiellales bacterium]
MSDRVFSFHPQQAGQIFDELKCVEFRRPRVSVRPGDRASVYETAPVGKVTGEFVAGEVSHGAHDTMLALEPNDETRSHGAGYVAESPTASAIRVQSPRRHDRPRAPRDGRPPLSYRRAR